MCYLFQDKALLILLRLGIFVFHIMSELYSMPLLVYCSPFE